jgi:hypothetical protein
MWSYVVLKIVRASYICMNGLTQLVSGYSLSSGHSNERRDMLECYERSAHVISVKMKRRKFELEGPELTHFVLRKGNINLFLPELNLHEQSSVDHKFVLQKSASML